MHRDILKMEEKLSGLKSALADFEARRAASLEAIAKEREALAAAEAELFELRVQSKLDVSVSGSIPSRQRAAEKRREAIEEAEISEIAYGRKIGELRREIALAEDAARKVRNAILLDKTRELRERYSTAVGEATQTFERLAVAVSQLWQDGGKGDLKTVSPELLHFPQATQSAEVLPGAPNFLILELNNQGELKRVFPNKMSKERRSELLTELLS